MMTKVCSSLFCVLELIAAEKTSSPRESRLKVYLLVALTTNHPKQDTQIATDTRHTHFVVTWENKFAQAGKGRLDSVHSSGHVR